MRKAEKRNIVDELCACGAKKSEHVSRMHDIGHATVGVPGHGACKRTKCKQFTWDSWIFEDEITVKAPKKMVVRHWSEGRNGE
jgi:hypothetical protein